MIRWMLTAAALAVSGLALAKLPAPQLDEAAKAKAAEAAARTAWQAKRDNYLLCKAQDRVAAIYKQTAATKATAAPAAAAPTGVAPAAAAPAAAAPAAAAPAAPAAVATATSASQGGSTPNPATAAAPALPPCSDPGPFAYAPPDQRPLEASEAHSPTATAASPPSGKTPSAEMAPAKPSTATKK